MIGNATMLCHKSRLIRNFNYLPVYFKLNKYDGNERGLNESGIHGFNLLALSQLIRLSESLFLIDHRFLVPVD